VVDRTGLTGEYYIAVTAGEAEDSAVPSVLSETFGILSRLLKQEDRI
jgi:ABC-type transporter Mla subunit MlaD